MASPVDNLFRLAAKRPLLLAGGVAGVSLLAVLHVSRQGAAPLVAEDDSGGDLLPAGDLGIGPVGGSLGGPPAGSPYFGGPPPMGYDPFGSSTYPLYPDGGSGAPAVTVDGCSWPPPAIPAGMTGKGAWQCDSFSGTWTWHWISGAPPEPGGQPGTTPEGCPLPKPTVPPAQLGQAHYVCRAGGWALEAIVASPPTTPPSAPPPAGGTTYRVQRGDTLTRIAARYATTPAAIVAANRARYPRISLSYIQAGWVLAIPGRAAAPAVPLPPSPTRGTTYRVQRGDTLTRIAARYGVTVRELVTVNRARYPRITRDYIQVGWTLAIPGRAN